MKQDFSHANCIFPTLIHKGFSSLEANYFKDVFCAIIKAVISSPSSTRITHLRARGKCFVPIQNTHKNLWNSFHLNPFAQQYINTQIKPTSLAPSFPFSFLFYNYNTVSINGRFNSIMKNDVMMHEFSAHGDESFYCWMRSGRFFSRNEKLKMIESSPRS